MTYFFNLTSKSLANLIVGHIANQDLATRGGSVTRMRAHRERQRRNAPSARQNIRAVLLQYNRVSFSSPQSSVSFDL